MSMNASTAIIQKYFTRPSGKHRNMRTDSTAISVVKEQSGKFPYPYKPISMDVLKAIINRLRRNAGATKQSRKETGTVRHQYVVRPKPGSRYKFNVLLFDSRTAMYAWVKNTYGDKSKDYRAACLDLFGHGYHLGDIVFCLKDITPELISHESNHAAHHYIAIAKGKPKDFSDEEYMATITGFVTQDVIEHLLKLGMVLQDGKDTD